MQSANVNHDFQTCPGVKYEKMSERTMEYGHMELNKKCQSMDYGIPTMSDAAFSKENEELANTVSRVTASRDCEHLLGYDKNIAYVHDK